MNNSQPSPLSVSVIIPVYNGGNDFRLCLDSLRHTYLTPLEVIVVADGDTDGSGKVAQEFGAKVIRQASNQGPAAARNRGAEIAQGKILFFMDADVTIHPDTLEKVAQIFREHEGVAALIGSYDEQPGAKNFLSQYKNLFHHYTHQTAAEEASTFWGACGAIRRDIFLKMGGFDSRYRRPCVEDIELGYRLKEAGYRILLCKDIQVKHLKRWTPYSLLRADFFYRALPWTQLIHRYRYLSNDLNLQWSSRLSVIFTYLLLAMILGSFWFPYLLVVAFLLVLGLLILNAPVYRFFKQKRGLAFTLRVLPWHWFYYFYSGLAFVIGTVRYWVNPKSVLTFPWLSSLLSL